MISVMKYETDPTYFVGLFYDFKYCVDNIIRNGKIDHKFVNEKEIEYLDKLKYEIKNDYNNEANEFQSKKVKEIYLASKDLFVYLSSIKLYDIDKYSTFYLLFVCLPHFESSVKFVFKNKKRINKY